MLLCKYLKLEDINKTEYYLLIDDIREKNWNFVLIKC